MRARGARFRARLVGSAYRERPGMVNMSGEEAAEWARSRTRKADFAAAIKGDEEARERVMKNGERR